MALTGIGRGRDRFSDDMDLALFSAAILENAAFFAPNRCTGLLSPSITTLYISHQVDPALAPKSICEICKNVLPENTSEEIFCGTWVRPALMQSCLPQRVQYISNVWNMGRLILEILFRVVSCPSCAKPWKVLNPPRWGNIRRYNSKVNRYRTPPKWFNYLKMRKDQ